MFVDNDFLSYYTKNDPSRNRTGDLLLRRQLLYPAEPRDQNKTHYIKLYSHMNNYSILLNNLARNI